MWKPTLPWCSNSQSTLRGTPGFEATFVKAKPCNYIMERTVAQNDFLHHERCSCKNANAFFEYPNMKLLFWQSWFEPFGSIKIRKSGGAARLSHFIAIQISNFSHGAKLEVSQLSRRKSPVFCPTIRKIQCRNVGFMHHWAAFRGMNRTPSPMSYPDFN